MELTGKCKKDFEVWVHERRYSILHDVGDRHMNIVPLGGMIEQLDSSMKYGVYEDFFDSVGIVLEISNNGKALITFWVEVGDYEIDEEFDTRKEARIGAIKKANNIYNDRV